MSKYSLYIVSLLSLLVITACERRPLEDEGINGNNALVQINIDWSQSGLDMDNTGTRKHRASVWVFNKGLDEHFEFVLENDLTSTTIPLAVGHYSIIVFNETTDSGDWAALEFDGTEKYETFRVTSRLDSENKVYGRAESNQELRKAPDGLAVWSLDEFEVTQQMVEITRSRAGSKSSATTAALRNITRAEQEAVEKELGKVETIIPTMITKPLQIKLYVHNLSSAAPIDDAIVGVIKGMTRGIYMASRKAVEGDAVSHSFTLKDRKWDDPNNPINGTTEASIFIFGTSGGKADEYTVQVDFLLNDGTTVPSQVFDVTEQINNSPEGEIHINIGSTDPNKPIDPDKPKDPDRPVVLPANVTGDVGVEGWENNEIIIK